MGAGQYHITHLLALDLATTTGWASWSADDDAPEFGHVTFAGDVGAFANGLEGWLFALLGRAGGTDIFVEAPITGGTRTNLNTTMKLIGAQVIVRKVAHALGLAVTSVAVSAWRSRFIGCCRAPKTIPKSKRRKWLKDAAVAECRRRGWITASDDEADALGLLSVAREMRSFDDVMLAA